METEADANAAKQSRNSVKNYSYIFHKPLFLTTLLKDLQAKMTAISSTMAATTHTITMSHMDQFPLLDSFAVSVGGGTVTIGSPEIT